LAGAGVARVRQPLSLPAGRLVELSGVEGRAARTTAALCVVAHAQRAGEPAAWIQPEGGGLFPPDAAEAGVDLDALVVVHVPRGAKGAKTAAGQAAGLARAAELLLRSGGFGAVVLDLRGGVPAGEAWQGRLAGLARQHECYLIVITEESAQGSAVGPLVAVRLRPTRRRETDGAFLLEAEVLRNKSARAVEPEPQHLRPPRGAP
jgi:recombination protein RecA